MLFEIDHTRLAFLSDHLQDADILSKLEKAKNNGRSSTKGKYSTGKYIVDLTETDVDLILEDLSDSITKSGVDSNGNLNASGYAIEDLIDIFHAGKL